MAVVRIKLANKDIERLPLAKVKASLRSKSLRSKCRQKRLDHSKKSVVRIKLANKDIERLPLAKVKATLMQKPLVI